VTSIGGSLQVLDNSALEICDVESICFFLENGGPATISNNATGCNSQSEVEDSCRTVSVSDINQDSVYTVFPNPAKGQLFIIASFDIVTSGAMVLYDILGRPVYNYWFKDLNLKHQIDLNPYSPGIYFLEIRTGSGRFVENVVLIE